MSNRLCHPRPICHGDSTAPTAKGISIPPRPAARPSAIAHATGTKTDISERRSLRSWGNIGALGVSGLRIFHRVIG